MTPKAFLLMVAAGILSGCNIQYKLLYYPSSSVPSEELLRADQIKPWPSSITDYRGFIASEEVGQTNGTVVVFHGNGGTAADRTFYVKELGPLGYRVVLAEYPRYGGRKGELGEKAFVNDASETVRLAFVQYGEPFFILGESLGCAIAAAVAKVTSTKIKGVVLITPWDTFASVAQSKFRFLPVQLFLKDKYDSINNLTSFKGNIAVVGAERDEVVPIVHAKNLYNSLSGTAKRMWIIQGTGHNDWPMSTSASWWKEIMDFVSNNNKR
jgi:alpha-beta hydrolase superfamily lysophospholipase